MFFAGGSLRPLDGHTCRPAADQLRCIYLLLAHGANVKVQDAHGQTPLHCAAFSGEAAQVRAIMEAVRAWPRTPWSCSFPGTSPQRMHLSCIAPFRFAPSPIRRASCGQGGDYNIKDSRSRDPFEIALEDRNRGPAALEFMSVPCSFHAMFLGLEGTGKAGKSFRFRPAHSRAPACCRLWEGRRSGNRNTRVHWIYSESGQLRIWLYLVALLTPFPYLLYFNRHGMAPCGASLSGPAWPSIVCFWVALSSWSRMSLPCPSSFSMPFPGGSCTGPPPPPRA